MIALIENLLKAQAEAIGKLEARIKGLAEEACKDSQNSRKPPSGDGYKQRTQRLRSQSGRQRGGQPGHLGRTLAWVEQPDELAQHLIATGQGCGASLALRPSVAWQGAQVHAFVPLEIVVREHQAAVKACNCCGHSNQAAFPVGVTNRAQSGFRWRRLMVYLMDDQLWPSARVQARLSEVFGCQWSEGTLDAAREHCLASLAEVAVGLLEALPQAEVAHFDETGRRVKAQRLWLHVASTTALTDDFIHPKRGSAALDALDILPQVEGTSVPDGWRGDAL